MSDANETYAMAAEAGRRAFRDDSAELARIALKLQRTADSMAANEAGATPASTSESALPTPKPKPTNPAPVASAVDAGDQTPAPTPDQTDDKGEPAWLAKFTDSRIKPIEDAVLRHDDTLFGTSNETGLVENMKGLQGDVERLNAAVFDDNGNRRRVWIRTRTVDSSNAPANFVPTGIALVVLLLIYIAAVMAFGLFAAANWAIIGFGLLVVSGIAWFTNRPNSTQPASAA